MVWLFFEEIHSRPFPFRNATVLFCQTFQAHGFLQRVQFEKLSNETLRFCLVGRMKRGMDGKKFNSMIKL